MSKAYFEEFTPSFKIKDVDKLELFGLDILSKEQLAPHAPSTTDIDEFNRPLGAQEQVPKFSSSPIQQGSETTASAATLGFYETREVNRFQLLIAAVDTLVNITEDQLLTTLTENDYQGLVASLDKLIDAVGEDENHFLAPLMHFIGTLIEKYEEQSTITNWTESSDAEETKTERNANLRLPGSGLEAAYSNNETEYTLDMLTSVNPNYAGLNENGEISLRLPARGLEAAYGDDEPEYTLDMLISVNPEHGES